MFCVDQPNDDLDIRCSETGNGWKMVLSVQMIGQETFNHWIVHRLFIDALNHWIIWFNGAVSADHLHLKSLLFRIIVQLNILQPILHYFLFLFRNENGTRLVQVQWLYKLN